MLNPLFFLFNPILYNNITEQTIENLEKIYLSRILAQDLTIDEHYRSLYLLKDHKIFFGNCFGEGNLIHFKYLYSVSAICEPYGGVNLYNGEFCGMKYEPTLDDSNKWNLKQVFLEPEIPPLNKYLKFYTSKNKVSNGDGVDEKEVCILLFHLLILFLWNLIPKSK